MMIATIVDTNALLQTIGAAFVAGVGATIIVSLAILGSVRFADANRDGRTVEAVLFGALALLGTVATVGAAVLAVIVMTTK
jgi:hypothetical protein